MKRLTFKPEHVEPIKNGTKRFTSRWRDPKLKVGDVVAAVTGQNGKPAFLTPANDAFATLRITSVEKLFWKDFTEDDARRCGVTRGWYLKEKPFPDPLGLIHMVGFEEVL